VAESTGASRGWVGAQYLGLAVTWGCSFLFIKIGLDGLSATQVVLGRLVTGALVLVAVSGWTRQPPPREPAAWGHLGVLAVLMCVAPFLLFAWAERAVPSGLASIYNATTPLMTMLVAMAALTRERPTRAVLAGLAIGFGGVLVVLGPWQVSWHDLGGGSGARSGGGSALAQGACLLATACYGVAFVYLRRFVTPRGLAAVPVATVQVGLAALMMLAVAPWTADARVDVTPRVAGSVLVLGAMGTGLAYVWNTNVVVGWGATNASTVTYLTPVVGVVVGVLVLGERVTWNEPVGALVVIAGIAIGQGRVTRMIGKLKTSPLTGM
jgi:drug/metabolite transporter (DMT)-like permease